MNLTFAQRLAGAVAVVTTPCVAILIATLLFLNPTWVAFDQDRSDVSGITGYTSAEVNAVTGSILSDLVFGPPNFDVTVNGTQVLDPREQTHMRDVRTVLSGLGLIALIAVLLLVIVGLAARGAHWFWRAVALGGRVLVVGVIVAGVGFALFFDQAFELFHEIFFPPGTYMFDIRTEKLVQLFPDQFWSETSVALCAAILGLGILTAVVAARLGREPDGSDDPHPSDTATRPVTAGSR